MLGQAKWALPVAVVALLMVSGILVPAPSSAHPVRPSTSNYTVGFTEVGLPLGSSWTMTFNGSTTSTSLASTTFATIPPGSYSWSIATPVPGTAYGVEYVPTISTGYLTVPGQLTQVVVFQTEYLVQLNSSIPNEAALTPDTPTYFPAHSNVTLTAVPYTGYTGGGWQGSPSGSAHLVAFAGDSADYQLNGPANFTAMLHRARYTVTFQESGRALPPGTSWSVVYGGTTYSTTASTLSIPNQYAGYTAWSIPEIPFTSSQMIEANAPSGYLDPPFSTVQQVLFIRALQVSFSSSYPSGSYGYTVPSTTAFYPAGTELVVDAYAFSSTNFSKWSASGVKLSAHAGDSIVADVVAPGSIHATFTAGTPCSSTCTATFQEVGLPTVSGKKLSATWGVTYNGSFSGATTPTISFRGVNASTADGYWSVASPIYISTTGVYYVASPSSGYLLLPYQTTQVIAYTAEAYVTFASNPLYSGGQISLSSGFFPIGSVLPISAVGTPYEYFSGWASSSGLNLAVGASSNESTNLTILGSGSVTANFAPPLQTVTFTEAGLKKGLVWGVTFNGVTLYGTAGTTKTSSITISSVPASYYSWAAISPVNGGTSGVQYAATPSTGVLDVSVDNGQVVVFSPLYLVTVSAVGVAGGTVSPSAGAFYAAGTVLAISAINGTSATFVRWNSSNAHVPVNAPMWAATYIVVTAPVTITAKFA